MVVNDTKLVTDIIGLMYYFLVVVMNTKLHSAAAALYSAVREILVKHLFIVMFYLGSYLDSDYGWCVY